MRRDASNLGPGWGPRPHLAGAPRLYWPPASNTAVAGSQHMLTQDRAVAGDPAAPGGQAPPLWLQFPLQACGKADPYWNMTAGEQTSILMGRITELGSVNNRYLTRGEEPGQWASLGRRRARPQLPQVGLRGPAQHSPCGDPRAGGTRTQQQGCPRPCPRRRHSDDTAAQTYLPHSPAAGTCRSYRERSETFMAEKRPLTAQRPVTSEKSQAANALYLP